MKRFIATLMIVTTYFVAGITASAIYFTYKSPEMVGAMICDVTTDDHFEYVGCRLNQNL